VAESVAKIQQCPATLGGKLVFVGLHNAGFHLTASADNRRHPVVRRCEDGLLQLGEERSIAEQAVFDHLGHAGGELAGRQRPQEIRCDIHRPGMMEGAHEILAGSKIDARLPTDGTVHHREQCRRHLHILDTTQITGGGETTEIAHNPTSNHPQLALPGDPVRSHKIEHAAESFQRLRFFSGGYRQSRDSAKIFGQKFCLLLGDAVIRQEHGRLPPLCRFSQHLFNGTTGLAGNMNRVSSGP
jgi:hypothetical protein